MALPWVATLQCRSRRVKHSRPAARQSLFRSKLEGLADVDVERMPEGMKLAGERGVECDGKVATLDHSGRKRQIAIS